MDVDGDTIKSECPDALKMTLDGEIKYVVSTGGTSYIVGSIYVENKKIIFRGEQSSKKMFSGPFLWCNRGELYATQSFFNDKYGRTILLSWVVDRTASILLNKKYNGAHSLPMEAKLVRKNDEILLNLYPIKELDNYLDKTLVHSENIVLKEKETFEISETNNNKYDLQLSIEAGTAVYFEICFGEASLKYSGIDNILSFISVENNTYGFKEKINLVNEQIKLRIIADAYILEVYVNDGENNLHTVLLEFSDIKT